MPRSPFRAEVWGPALEKYAGVTRLTVIVYDADGQPVVGPINPTPLFTAFARAPSDPGLFLDCAQQCLRQRDERSTVVVAKWCGLAVVGTPLVLNDQTVGAAVAGYHLIEFPQAVAVQRAAAESGVAFAQLWDVIRRATPLTRQRFIIEGELLQILADTILRESHRTRQYEEVASQLSVAAAAKDEFLAVLSHELRTPLTPILGWARMLKLGTDPAQVARAAEIIERNAVLQSKLVEDLLELTRVARGKVTLDLGVSDLNDAIRSTVDAYLDPAKQKGVVLEVIESRGPLLVIADANRLQQIFRNVMGNALKFTQPGGRVTVALSTAGQSGVVTIRDTGEGIAPDFLPFVFDIFRQQEHGTRRRHDGLGIGLALVKRLTELQDGQVDVVSSGVGQGTAVTIRFPLVSDLRVAPVPLPPDRIDLRELKGLLLLVVEDMDDTREAMRRILERLGANVIEARDGVEALEIVDAVRPDAVLCDLRMPRMDGYEFIRALHERPGGPAPPVIAVTGFASPEDHRRTEHAGFEGHLDKPFDDVGLLAAVGAVLGRRR